jgi:hypothetical protein
MSICTLRETLIPLQASVRAWVYDEPEAKSKDGVAILHCPEAFASSLRLMRGDCSVWLSFWLASLRAMYFG